LLLKFLMNYFIGNYMMDPMFNDTIGIFFESSRYFIYCIEFVYII
jgi:hypothetical protein